MKNKKIAAVICMCTVAVSSLIGCGSTAGEVATPSGEGSAESPAAKTEETPVVSIFNRINPEVNVENNPLLEALGEKVGVKIEYNAPPINNYNEKLQITMASETLPDIIYNWGAADSYYESWAADGLLAELDDKIQNYPNIMATIPESYWEAVRSTNTGKIHAIPKTNVDNYWGFIINNTWLDNLGLQAPTTLEEFKEVCHAFTYDDPDGNGKDDTYAISFTKPDSTGLHLLALQPTFGLADVRDTDGNYKITQKKSGYLPYLTYIRELYADGVVDPEFITNERGTDMEKLIAGKAGIIVDHQNGVLSYLSKDPDACEKYTYIGSLKQPEGDFVSYIGPSMWGMWMISADADVDQCLKLIDYALSDEGFQLLGVGTEEYYNSYDFETRQIDRTEEQSAAVAQVTSTYMTFAYAKDGTAPFIENATTPERIDKFYKDYNAMKERTTVISVPAVRAPLSSTFAADNPDLVTKLTENEVKYIVNEMDEAAFTQFLNDEYYPAAEEMEAEYVQWMEDYEAGK